jgi:hypothetical protein
MGQNLTMHCNIRSQRTAITTIPARGDCSPKKAQDQSTLTTSCAAKTPKAIFQSAPFLPSRQTKKRDMPMRMKSTIQTPPITDPGGVKEGLISVGYQVETELLVKTEPRAPANWQMAIAKMILGISWRVMTVIRIIIIFFFLYSSFLWAYLSTLSPLTNMAMISAQTFLLF